MESVYSYTALFGSVLVVLQTALALIGLADTDLDVDGVDMDVDVDFDVDVDLDVGSDVDVSGGGVGDGWFVGMLSTRAIIAAVALFGLTGLSLQSKLGSVQTMFCALGAGFGTMYSVAFVIQSMHKLATDGTVRIHDTIGQSGTVYLPLPANKESVGKVTVCVGERTMEYAAVTAGERLSTGTPIVVVDVIGDTLEVAHVRETQNGLVGSGAM